MSLLVSAQLVVAGICLALGLQHGFVWIRRRGLVEVGMYTASSVEQYGAEIRLNPSTLRSRMKKHGISRTSVEAAE